MELVLEGFQGSVDGQVFTEVDLVVCHGTTVTRASHFLANLYVWFCGQGVHEVDIIRVVFKYLKVFLIRANGLE